jgi:cytochrome P450
MTDVSVTPVTTTDTSALDALILEIIGTEEGRRDPYSRYERIRAAAPIFRSSLGMWVCTGYDDCQTVLRDPHLGKAQDDATDAQIAARAGSATLGPDEEEWVRSRRSLLFLNPPDHTRLRGLVSKAFTPRTVERLRPEIERLVDELLDAFATGEPVDVIEALAFPLPVAVIGRMLGVPSEDWPRFRSIMQKTTVLLEPVVPQDELQEALATLRETDSYFLELVGLRRSDPQDDLISQLIAVEEGSDCLTERELIATATLLFGAGFETTTNLIGNGLYALLTHQDQLARLREDPELVRSAVEELLRFDSPVQLDARHAFTDVTIGGQAVREGETVMTMLGAANRDPDHFTDPARFDVGRDEGPPLSFGSGIHYCLGAALARVEAQVVLERLLARFATMELATDQKPVWRNRITIRGMTSLPVVFTPSVASAS